MFCRYLRLKPCARKVRTPIRAHRPGSKSPSLGREFPWVGYRAAHVRHRASTAIDWLTSGSSWSYGGRLAQNVPTSQGLLTAQQPAGLLHCQQISGPASAVSAPANLAPAGLAFSNEAHRPDQTVLQPHVVGFPDKNYSESHTCSTLHLCKQPQSLQNS